MEFSANEFGDRLQELRKRKNISARKLSLLLGQNRYYINCIELHRALPSMAKFFEICKALEVTPAEFFASK